MYEYKAVLEASERGGTYEKGVIPKTPRIHCRQELVPEIGRAVPELDGVVPCYMRSDHIRTCVKLVGSSRNHTF